MKKVHHEIYLFLRRVFYNWTKLGAEDENEIQLDLGRVSADSEEANDWEGFVSKTVEEQYKILFPDMDEENYKLQEHPEKSHFHYSL